MPTCPKCSSRKAKRACPALGVEICAPCCAEGRLKTIACPQDCPHLVSEFYQQKRRRDRAFSQGKGFVEANEKLFPDEKTREFAFNLQADIYFFLKRIGRIEDDVLPEVFEALQRPLSPIHVPGSRTQKLLGFLRERLEDTRRYPTVSGAAAEERLRALRALSSRARAAAAPGPRRLLEEIASFFDALDFEADLDYSPHDGREPGAPEGSVRTTPGGLLL